MLPIYNFCWYNNWVIAFSKLRNSLGTCSYSNSDQTFVANGSCIVLDMLLEEVPAGASSTCPVLRKLRVIKVMTSCKYSTACQHYHCHCSWSQWKKLIIILNSVYMYMWYKRLIWLACKITTLLSLITLFLESCCNPLQNSILNHEHRHVKRAWAILNASV